MFIRQVFCAIISLILLLCSCSSEKTHLGDYNLISPVGEIPGNQIKVLIIDGVNNHDWEMTTEATKATLEQTGRFKVDVSTSPRKRASKEEWNAYRPEFFDYDVVIGNFNDDCEEEDGCDHLWSPEAMEDFERFVTEGGGFVLIHGADNSWADWPEYNEMTGLGGWGGREAGKSGYLLRLIDGKWQPTSPNKGLSGEHGREREFLMIHDKPSHPILKGLPTEWMHAKDELYSALRGPAKNIEVLAHSYSLYTKENEPTLFLITYGKGKVFHIPLGHDGPGGGPLHCVGYQTVMARGTEYVATGKVTIGIPESFPTKEKAVVIAPDKVKWPGMIDELAEDNEEDRYSRSRRRRFTKQVEVLGIRVLATADSRDEIVLHVANVLAEYLDNDEDGVADNQEVMDALIRGKAAYEHANDDEVHPNGAAEGLFDASLEEVLHMITDQGYGVAYPDVFGRVPGTEISNLLDKARGGRLMKVPEQYPDDAWFTYDDGTCDYDCQNSEYIYWILTSILGAQDYPGRLGEIEREWRLNTREKVKQGDPDAYALFTNPKYKFPTVLPDGKYRAKTLTIQNRGDSDTVRFTKQVEVFGLHIYATNTTGDDKLLHAANVLAEYIDNDEDGVPDNPKIIKAMLERKGAIVMRKTERERPMGPRPRGQGLWDEETIPNGRAQGRFDASLEEILHMVTDYGWEGAYPEVFGRWPGTEIANAMDLARGGQFEEVPDEYPEDAWYSYYDETCDYNCQVAEYIYWAMTSILGAQDYPGGLEQIDNEWRLNTRKKVKKRDPAVYAILTNPEYKLPTVLPDGKYKAKTFTIQKYP